VTQWLLEGSYGTFEIKRVVEADTRQQAYEQTGIKTTLEDAGWTVSDIDGEDWSITKVRS